MLRRLAVGLALVTAVGLGAYVYVWKGRAAPGSPPSAAPSGSGLGEQARAFGEGARETLSEIGHELHDVRVAASVKTALSLNRGLRSSSIDVTAENGAVTLGGRVDGEEDRARAEALAAAVPGVTRVVNQIQVVAGPPQAPGRTLGETLEDRTVEARVALALSLDRELRRADVTVQAYRREVTLGGDVGSEALRERALQTARETVSVAGVVDRIRVRAVAVRPSASRAERAAAAQRAVNANPHLTAFDLQVREEGDRLVLRGAVRTPIEKDLAIVLAREAAGGGVDDGVEVRTGA
jgi:hyperosmotically inducible protein